MIPPPFKLRFTNTWGEKFFFQNLGGFWGPHDTRRLIERTSSQRAQGREFETVDAAKEVMQSSQMGEGWQIIDGDGNVVE